MQDRLAPLWGLLFPSRCLGCGRRGTDLCEACRRKLPRLDERACPRCAWPKRGDAVSCAGCRRLSKSLKTVRSGFAYEGAIRNGVLALKFKSARSLVPTLSELMRTSLKRPIAADLVVPVPLAPSRMKERGYNQTFLLAERVADLAGGVVVEALVREDRPAQRTLGAADRLLNLRGAFSCPDRSLVEGKRILILDDVMTTGATLSACAEALDAAGAAWVGGWVLARDL